jgi:hypothetical protein
LIDDSKQIPGLDEQVAVRIFGFGKTPLKGRVGV